MACTAASARPDTDFGKPPRAVLTALNRGISNSNLRLARVLRVGRLLRVLRVIRVARVFKARTCSANRHAAADASLHRGFPLEGMPAYRNMHVPNQKT